MAKFNISDLTITGTYSPCFWDKSLNPNATITDGLANCTTLTYGLTILYNRPLPVSRIVSAGQWHNYLINNWTCKKFDKSILKVGDIIEWSKYCHVATVDKIVGDKVYLHCSWYTGENGKSTEGKDYATREHIKTLQELSDIMSTKYSYRFYHYCTLEEESEMVKGEPEYILSMPLERVFKPVGEDKTVNQVFISTNKQNVRDNDNNILGTAQSGFYNVYSIVHNNNYDWYEIEDGCFVAGVENRVYYIPKEVDVETLKRENEMLRAEIENLNNRLRQIHDLSGD